MPDPDSPIDPEDAGIPSLPTEGATPPPDDVHAGDTIADFMVSQSGPNTTRVDSPSGSGTPPSGAVTPLTRGKTPSSASKSGKLGGKTEPDSTPAEIKAVMSDPARRVNQYVLLQQVGQGGMGSVWKAWDTKLARWVAIKFLNATEDESIRRFQREAQLAARLRHPNIATIYEVNDIRGLHFLVMDFIDGTSIGKAKLPIPRIAEAMVKVCRGMDYAHKNGIIHRDIKPQNIMVTAKDAEPFVTDFGLAKLQAAESSISVSGAILGTPAYMSPEQATGKIQDIDARSDIYSLGASMYMLVAGRAPFEAENATALLFKVCSQQPEPPRKLNPEIPEPLQVIILKAMEKDKTARYQTAGELADDIERFIKNQPISVRPPGLLGRLRRHARAVAIGLGLLTLVAGGAIAGVLFLKKDKPKTDWQAQFEKFQALLKWENFRSLIDEEIKECKETVSRCPDQRVEDLTGWLLRQADGILPAEVWPKSLWTEKKEDAKWIVKWCESVLAILDGATGPAAEKLRGLGDRLAKAKTQFSEVAQYGESDVDKKWRTEFDQVQTKIVWGGFKPLKPDETEALKKILAAMPPAMAEEAALWFEKQANEWVPEKMTWPKALWSTKQPEAEKIVRWSQTLVALLEAVPSALQDRFEVVESRAANAITEFKPVADHVESSGDREWMTKFEKYEPDLIFRTFRPLPGTRAAEIKLHMKGLPDGLVDRVVQFFETEAGWIPSEPWKKSMWLSKQAEARQIVEYASAIRTILDGAPAASTARFQKIRDVLSTASQKFSPIAAFLGKITLKIFVWPYAEIRSLKTGETWIVQGGKIVKGECGSVVGDELGTPVVIQDLDIDTVTLELALPDNSTKTWTIAATDLKNGESYVFGGSATGTLKLRKLP